MGTIASHLRRNLVAYLALFVALGSTGYAAGSKLLPRNSVGSAQVINKSLLAKDFKKGQLPKGARGAPGAPGVSGAKGDPGTQGPRGVTGPSTGPASGDLQGTYPGPTIKDGAVTAAKLAPADPWHYVGTVGEPPFAAGEPCDTFYGTGWDWHNYQAGYDLDWNRVAFFKDPFGVVHLKGLINDQCVHYDDNANAGKAMFELPPAYRSSRGEIMLAASQDGPHELRVSRSGVVFSPVGFRGFRWLSMDGLTFRAG